MTKPNKTFLPGHEWGFVPKYLGAVQKHKQFTWESDCYSKNVAEIHGDFLDERVVHVTSTGRKNSTCKEFYLFATIDGTAEYRVEADEATKHWTAPILSWRIKGGKEWFDRVGIRVFKFYVDREEAIIDLVDTIKLFVPSDTKGPGEPLKDEKYVLDFLAAYSNISYERRPPEHYLVNIDPKTIKSGTAMGCMRPDGLASLEMWATGAHTSHWTMLMRDAQDELYVVESTAKGNYWPAPHIQKHRWADWVQLALKANMSVLMFPLDAEKQAKFDEQEAWKFINKSLGLPYGYHNFIFGWLDTPEGNNPFPVSSEVLEVLLGIIWGADTSFGIRLVGEALSFRLTGTWKTNLTVAEAANKAAEKGMTFGQLYSIPEQDSWVYSDGTSMVCDVFCCHIYKAGGLFGDLADKINCVEMHNRDFYSLKFFSLDQNARPEACKVADPDLDYCMVMGPWRVKTPQHNSVEPYAHMAERCAAHAPGWQNTPKGC
eukprot:TRINITY_DN95097_c0_g1_i1.p1 TRINITY_DN95097_c0_g1~~TRINITY_DN95097_c0_g1_i1.p1  ORF type:complete len:569 (+),score=59.53 TRINITY_DN95097_c0_g1_i1:247-1707(+)